MQFDSCQGHCKLFRCFTTLMHLAVCSPTICNTSICVDDCLAIIIDRINAMQVALHYPLLY